MKKYFWISLVLLLFSCTEKYNRNISYDTNYLIVEGMVTNLVESNEITLTRTSPLNDESTILYEENATVQISDNNGNTVVLDEVSPGKYQTDPAEFVGQIGSRYALSITTQGGEVYESDPVLLNDVVDIDSVFVTLNKELDYSTNSYKTGVDINISTKEWKKDEQYYLKWDFVETWKLFPTFYAENRDDIPHVPCYNVKKSSEIVTDNTSLYSSKKIAKKKVAYLSEKDYRPYFGYSILIRQTALNESVWQFWKMLKENTEENGNVFDKMPYNAICNIHCVSNKKLKVFGYFNASKVSEKRYSFKPPLFGIKFYNIYDDCNMLTFTKEQFKSYLIFNKLDSSDVYIYDRIDGNVLFFIDRDCVDCSQKSTTTQKPDYWLFN